MKSTERSIPLLFIFTLFLTLMTAASVIVSGCDDDDTDIDTGPTIPKIFVFKSIVQFSDTGHDYTTIGAFPATTGIPGNPVDGDTLSHEDSCVTSKAVEGVGVTYQSPFIVNGSANHDTLANIANMANFPSTTDVGVYGPTGIMIAASYNDFLAGVGSWESSVTLYSAGVLPNAANTWWSGVTNQCDAGSGDWTDGTTTGSYGDDDSIEANAAGTCSTQRYRLCIGW